MAASKSEAGNAPGQFQLGYAYQLGRGTEKDWAAAVKWYELAAAQGDTAAMNNLGAIYRQGGHGVAKDLDVAVSWDLIRWEKGRSGYSAGNLGDYYYNGLGVTKDLATARSWYKKGADKEDANSMYRRGMMLFKGEGGAQDRNRGLKLIQSAAAKGHTAAVSCLETFDSIPFPQ